MVRIRAAQIARILVNNTDSLSQEREGRSVGVEKSRGWRVINFDALKTPPEGLAAALYVLAVVLFFYVVYMIGLGLVAFTQLGHEIVFGSSTTAAVAAGGSSLTIFFSVLLALVGGPLVIWRVITSHVQAQAARHQAETAREGHYTDLFTKAVEQLGATREVKKIRKAWTLSSPGSTPINDVPVVETEPNLEVRLGAIYALERIARDSERDHWPIMEVLCAYIRNPQNCGPPTPSPQVGEDRSAWFVRIPELRIDVQAALDAIGRRPAERVAYEIDQNLKLNLSNANLQRASLKGMFAKAIFMGANLDRAAFVGTDIEQAVFLNASLLGAVFKGANLRGALVWEGDMKLKPLEEAIEKFGDDWAVSTPPPTLAEHAAVNSLRP